MTIPSEQPGLVQPLKEEKHIKQVKKLLENQPRNFALFVIGINVALRASDLTTLTVGHIRSKRPGDDFRVWERKTKKWRTITINESMYDALKKLNIPADAADEVLLFPSRKGENKPLSVKQVRDLVKLWTSEINLRENYGSHSLRKTWGYMQRTRFGTSLEIISDSFGHSSTKVTLAYICLQPEEIRNAYMNNI